MSVIQQAIAKRRQARQDRRYQPKKGNRAGIYLNMSQRRAAARNRKRIQAGGAAGSIGYKVK